MATSRYPIAMGNHSRNYDFENVIRERLRDGDLTVCEQFIRMHGGRLLAMTRRLLGNEDDAWDALRDAFLRAFRIFPTIEEDVPLSTSLYRIAINAAVMKLRTRRSQPEWKIDELLPTFLEDGRRARVLLGKNWPKLPSNIRRPACLYVSASIICQKVTGPYCS